MHRGAAGGERQGRDASVRVVDVRTRIPGCGMRPSPLLSTSSLSSPLRARKVTRELKC